MKNIPNNYPPIPFGITREEVIEGLRDIAKTAADHQREIDPSFVRWPELDAVLDYIENNGFTPPQNSSGNQI